MDILGLGAGELVLILVLALIIFGPRKLPEMASQIGRAVRDVRKTVSELGSEFNQSLRLEIEDPAKPKGPNPEPRAPSPASQPPSPIAEHQPPEYRPTAPKEQDQGSPSDPAGPSKS